jgi:competence protein ComEC
VTADLRTTLLGCSAWAGALAGLLLRGSWLWAVVALAGVTAAVLAVPPLTRRRTGLVVACLVVVAVVGASAGLRSKANDLSPVAALARTGAVVDTVLVVRSDPVTRKGRFGDYVLLHAQVRSLTTRGRQLRSSVAVLVIADDTWGELELGEVIRATGRLRPSLTGQEAAVFSGVRPPVIVQGPPRLLQVAAGVRAAVRRAAAGGPGESSALVPALVTGEDQALSEGLVDDFRTAGLTHLTAVSGTNLTLVLAFLLLLARWAGVRGRGHLVVGLLGVVAFVLMARPEPSVLRAAAMGTVALLGLGSGGRAAGVRALGAAMLLLLVLDPWLALSPGFALSTLATAGILFVAPGLRDALSVWLPRSLAEAVAVPLAAQLACTPLVAVLSGQVSLVAVLANLVVAPLVGPATVLGLSGGLVATVMTSVGVVLARPACWCAWLIIETGHRAASLPTASVEWPVTATRIAVLLALTVVLLLTGPRLLRRRRESVLAALLLVVVLVRPLPHPGWPPRGWVLVMCDVGQGDALVLATGHQEAVVVDSGPDPSLVDGCLRRLGVRRVPVVLLTHFHADHVDGLPGVLRGRGVGEVEVGPFREPAYGAEQVDEWAAAADVGVRVPAYGEVMQVGEVTWRVEAPRRILDDSPNDASVVWLVETHGVRLLLTGDVEPPSQAALLREDLGEVDVLKVPHHGSRYQDDRLLTGLGARVALISVGADNDYGHPDPRLVDLLERSGMDVRRTDEDGDVAVVVRDGGLRVVSQGS